MSAPTLPTPRPAVTPPPAARAPVPSRPQPNYADARRTLAALVATGLAILPLRGIFTDWQWLVDGWVAMAIAIVPAAALRLRWQPQLLHLVPGLVLATVFLTNRYVPTHAYGGLLPLRGAWTDVNTLLNQFGDTIRDQSAPLSSTPGVRLLLSSLLVLVVIAVDLIAVVARRPALAGVLYLVVFTVAGAVPRHPVNWLWFVLAATGYLLLLAADEHDELSRWGRVMPRSTAASALTVRALSGRRIGLIAVLLAICVPFLLPVRGSNVVANAFHHNGSGSGTGNGSGSGKVSVDPLASLKGTLTLGKPVDLFQVQTTGASRNPFYLRQNVLDHFDGSKWSQSDNGRTEALSKTQYGPLPASGAPDHTNDYSATITIQHLGGNPPVFQNPTAIDGLSDTTAWAPNNQLLVNGKVRSGQTYTEQVSEPTPSLDQLDTSPPLDPKAYPQYTSLPAGTPDPVTSLVSQLTSTAGANPYQQARAISDYFTTPSNGFTYSLSTKAGDSNNDLVNFLETKTGFCQQYAAAMAVMLRVAGIPSRVVIGYTHAQPDASGKFTVTTRDAHAWVEAYFGSVGWLPFDPTPAASVDPGHSAVLPWAPHATAAAVTGSGSTASATPTVGSVAGHRTDPANGDGTALPSTATSSSGPGWQIWLTVALVAVLILLLGVPSFVRTFRRRSRLHAASRGPDPLWAELAATATDLGYVWSPTRTPRQVLGWLDGEGLSPDATESLRELAVAVEEARYAPASTLDRQPAELRADLKVVEASLRNRRDRGTRTRARLLPDSLGWRFRRRPRRR